MGDHSANEDAVANFLRGEAEREVRCARDRQRIRGMARKERVMNLVVWLPALFVLGMILFLIAYSVLLACERI
jgi:hypothetical protein